MSELKIGDAVDVEIAGTAIGEAFLSEVTEDFTEFVFMGKTFRLGPNALDYFDLFSLYP